MDKKFELTDESIEVDGRTLFRIRALRDFGDVQKGVLGGYVETEANLSHEGYCWIHDDAAACGQAKVLDQARVSGQARVFGRAKVFGYAGVYGNIKISGDSKWSLRWEDNPSYHFFENGLEINGLAIETKDDLIHNFPEWYV